MTIYQWKPAARLRGDAQVIGEYLAQLREEKGKLTAPLVVDAAKDEQSPLHQYFDWNDDAAAQHYREYQAYHLLRSITIKIEHTPQEKREVRAFVVVHVDAVTKEQSYEPVLHVMTNEELRTQVLQRAWQELLAWRDRYHDYKELAAVFAAAAQAWPEMAAAGA